MDNVGASSDLGSVSDLEVAPDLLPPRRAPTDHPPLPLLSNMGGPVLAAPEVWTVVWPGDEMLGNQVNMFVGWMVQSSYWVTLKQYGVGAGVAKGVIVMPSAAPKMLDDSAFDGFVSSLAAMHPANANTLFAFVTPLSTVVSFGGGASCVAYGGYHHETRTGIAYAVNANCPFDGLQGLDDLAPTLSHEIAEAATDPKPFTLPAWYQANLGNGEVGDMCGGVAQIADGSGHSYQMQRLYSNDVARTGTGEPCLPAPSGPYFNAAIDPYFFSMQLQPDGSGTTTAKIEPYAFGAVGQIQWVVQSFDFDTGMKSLVFSPSSGVASAGDTIVTTISAPPGTTAGLFGVYLTATTQTGAENSWYAEVTLQ
jgi:hypothetical protein